MKAICIYHSRDLDGWMSAAIVKKWFKQLYGEDGVNGCTIDGMMYGNTYFAPKNTLDFLGWDYGNKMPDLSEYDNVIMCDISFPKEVMLDINLRLGTNFIWIDHHQRTVNEVNDHLIWFGIEMEGNVTEDGELKAACELTWEFFFPSEKMPEIVRRLGRYDCFGHTGTDEELTILVFQYGARRVITNYQEAYDALMVNEGKGGLISRKIDAIMNAGDTIYDWECTVAKQIYKNAFPINFGEYTFLAVNHQRFNPVNFGIKYHNDKVNDIYYADGFASFYMLPDGKWSFSLYNDNGCVDCSEIAKSFGGGGHKGAAGFIVANINSVVK